LVDVDFEQEEMIRIVIIISRCDCCTSQRKIAKLVSLVKRNIKA